MNGARCKLIDGVENFEWRASAADEFMQQEIQSDIAQSKQEQH